MNEIIRFYRVDDAYGQFSNFAAYPIEIEGKTWPTTEHYFQAQKFRDERYREKIRKTKSPMQAAILGRDRNKKLRSDWEAIKDQVMYRALQAKFLQYEELKQLLLNTAEAEIIEHTENDAYWADGGDGSGLNRLGELLMQLRQEIRSQGK